MPKPKTDNDYLPFEIPADYDERPRIHSVEMGTVCFMIVNDHFDTDEANEWEAEQMRRLAGWIVEACNAYANQ